jgi:hypothetical protein
MNPPTRPLAGVLYFGDGFEPHWDAMSVSAKYAEHGEIAIGAGWQTLDGGIHESLCVWMWRAHERGSVPAGSRPEAPK